ncbi:MAG TPA: hypothetical protein VJK03_02520 [Candidatus Nanoarchaeia archaeon]|nr:hypothetical protein [Candidatus Nanoarchaeia archaeon]
MAIEMNRNGQVALWVIVAVVMVSVLGLLFFLKPTARPSFQEPLDPGPAIEACMRRIAQEGLDIMLPQGGFVASANYKPYRKINVTYLCENTGYFLPCVQQHPFLMQEMEMELHNYSFQRIDTCFLDIKDAIEKKRTTATLGEQQLNVTFLPSYVRLHVEREMRIEEKGQVTIISSFTAELPSPSYELARVAIDAAGQEAKFCYFEYVGYMALHPSIDISKNVLSDETRIYTIRDISSGKLMNVAIRGCVIPPGI